MVPLRRPASGGSYQSLATALNSATQAVTTTIPKSSQCMPTLRVSNINNLSSLKNLDVEDISVKGTSARHRQHTTDVLDQRDAVLKQLSTAESACTVSRAGGDMAIYTDSGVTLLIKPLARFGSLNPKSFAKLFNQLSDGTSHDVDQFRQARGPCRRSPRQHHRRSPIRASSMRSLAA